MNKSLIGIGMLLILPTSTLVNAHDNPTVAALPEMNASVNMYFSPTEANSGESVTLHWSLFSMEENLGCFISGVPGISFVSDFGSYTFSASQSLNAFIDCEIFGEYYEDTYPVYDNATFTLTQTIIPEFDLVSRHSALTGARYAKIEVVNPVDLTHCDGDGIRWITTSGNYNVTCYSSTGGSKTKSIYLSVN